MVLLSSREAMRGEELILLTHASSTGAVRAEGRTREGGSEIALLGLVDKVDREKEVDGTRKLIAYITVCLQGRQHSKTRV